MEKTCETCAHFYRHYVKFGYRYGPVAAGHCGTPRRKLRWKDTPACPRYKERPGS
ncbi:hypothetical protein [uncultured Dysosmobacter sp.]|uniref:hypothetical protein n=1 Tax=uncultured Dysosmobacter sp. TaxID=2591384 RepID=UPI002610B446|nr:hypothetical protein [uncultured Dysosmobacter sp.]